MAISSKVSAMLAKRKKRNELGNKKAKEYTVDRGDKHGKVKVSVPVKEEAPVREPVSKPTGLLPTEKKVKVKKPTQGPVDLKKEEVEQVDEVSRRKLERYQDKAEDDYSHREHSGARGADNPFEYARKQSNRKRGLNRVDDKLRNNAKVNAGEETVHESRLASAVGTVAKIAAGPQFGDAVAAGAEHATRKVQSYLSNKLANVGKTVGKAAKAVDKVTKEETMLTLKQLIERRRGEVEQIDEISKKKTGEYLHAAIGDNEKSATSFHAERDPSLKDDMRKGTLKKMAKRDRGISTAIKKLTKEEVIFETEFASLTEEDLHEDKHLDQMSRHERAAYNHTLSQHHQSMAQRCQDFAHGENGDKWHKLAAMHLHKAATHANVAGSLKGKKQKSTYGESVEDDDSAEVISEISKKTLGSYANKATLSLNHAAQTKGSLDERPPADKDWVKRTTRKVKNRLVGMGRAIDKLAKD